MDARNHVTPASVGTPSEANRGLGLPCLERASTLAHMHRRSFLKSSALVGGLIASPAALAACAKGGGETAATIPEGEPSLVPVVASMELLTGSDQRIAFGLRTLENEPVPDAKPQVFLRGLDDKKVVAGPFEAAPVEDTGVEALYGTQVSVDTAGTMEFVVVNGAEFGSQAINAVAPEKSTSPVPGAAAKAVQTPTKDKKLGYTTVCTAEPPCGMHEISLDQALAKGQPVMLTFATPAYCQTAVCGPAVDNVEQARTSGEFSNVAWIHTEIYSDEGQTVGDPVRAWNLQSEPWVFAIGADGKIAGRLDGPIVPAWVTEFAEGIASA